MRAASARVALRVGCVFLPESCRVYVHRVRRKQRRASAVNLSAGKIRASFRRKDRFPSRVLPADTVPPSDWSVDRASVRGGVVSGCRFGVKRPHARPEHGVSEAGKVGVVRVVVRRARQDVSVSLRGRVDGRIPVGYLVGEPECADAGLVCRGRRVQVSQLLPHATFRIAKRPWVSAAAHEDPAYPGRHRPVGRHGLCDSRPAPIDRRVRHGRQRCRDPVDPILLGATAGAWSYWDDASL